MATGTLTNNSGSIIFSDNQVNTITLNTENKFVDSDITLTTKVTKAVLNGTTDHSVFNVQIPNGGTATLTLIFTTDSNGNTVVTGTDSST